MLTVEDYGVIRRANRDGMGIRAIARQFHHSRRKVRDALASPEPQPYTRTKEAEAPKLGPFKATIDQILADDELAPPKQRHTAMQVFRRLRGVHHYAGGYDQVRRYIWGHRQRHKVTFIPLSHDPAKAVIKLSQVPVQQRPQLSNLFGVHAVSPSRNRVPERSHRLAA